MGTFCELWVSLGWVMGLGWTGLGRYGAGVKLGRIRFAGVGMGFIWSWCVLEEGEAEF